MRKSWHLTSTLSQLILECSHKAISPSVSTNAPDEPLYYVSMDHIPRPFKAERYLSRNSPLHLTFTLTDGFIIPLSPSSIPSSEANGPDAHSSTSNARRCSALCRRGCGVEDEVHNKQDFERKLAPLLTRHLLDHTARERGRMTFQSVVYFQKTNLTLAREG